MNRKYYLLLLAAALAAAMPLAACGGPVEVVREVEVTRVVTDTVLEQGAPVEVTRIVVEVAAENVPPGTSQPTAPNPDIYTYLAAGTPFTLDPALAYDTAGVLYLNPIMETLIARSYTDPEAFIPVLAREVPSLANGLISADGLTYTFPIREGITFHEGGDLTPSDVAYTFQRGLLQSDPNGPQWLLIEPLMGYATGDITEAVGDGAYAGDPEGLLANAAPEELLAVCEEVRSRIVADDAAGTVTFRLAQPWGAFLSTLPGTWGFIVDREWAMAQGAWDGTCATWQEYYAPGEETTALGDKTNGTGPYRLERWTPGEDFVLVANENYWRTAETPLWPGGPYGAAAIDTVVLREVPEWGTRLAALQAGDAEAVAENRTVEPQVDALTGEFCDWQTGECQANPDNPAGPLRKWDKLPVPSRGDIFPTWNVAPDSPYLGSGKLDGKGIPPDFFADVDVRRAFATCFNYERFDDDVLGGNGIRSNGPIIKGMLGYNDDGPMYTYDPEQCADYLAQAWDGRLPETGFRLQIAYSTTCEPCQIIAEIYQLELAAINPLYEVEAVAMPWPSYLRAFRESKLPITIGAWVEDFHDPHNWAQPYTIGTFGRRQQMPEDVMSEFQALVTAGVQATTDAEREQIYHQLQQRYHDLAVAIVLFQGTSFFHEQRWVQGYRYVPGLETPNFYTMSLE